MKDAAPGVVLLGDEVEVRLQLSLACGAEAVPFDAVLVIDRSTSMLGAPIAAARQAALEFARLSDLTRSRIGVVSFAEVARVDARLSTSRLYLTGAIGALVARGSTDIAAGLRVAGSLLQSQAAGRVPVIILLSDGFNRNGAAAVRQQAAYQRDRGITLVTIAMDFGANTELMANIASSPDLAYVAPRSRHLVAIYQGIAGRLAAVQARDLVVKDYLPPGMELVAGSPRPPASRVGAGVRWRAGLVPADGVTMSLKLRPTRLGRQPTNSTAVATYADSLGRTGRVVFPIPVVAVLAAPAVTPVSPTPPAKLPTQPPTPEPAPTPSITRAPAFRGVFLPLVSRGGCPVTGRPADMVLVLDASTTMLEATAGGRRKIDAALDGAAALAAMLPRGGKRLGVVAFNREARVLVDLTDNMRAVTEALAALEVAKGSRIDRGLTMAATLVPEPHGSGHPSRRVVVLASDGRPVGATAEDVLAAAGDLTAAGARLV
ncbi:MAG: VWA domain-containing protein, partial [Anaerolineae bacterium]